jgi:hypothetical protein
MKIREINRQLIPYSKDVRDQGIAAYLCKDKLVVKTEV